MKNLFKNAAMQQVAKASIATKTKKRLLFKTALFLWVAALLLFGIRSSSNAQQPCNAKQYKFTNNETEHASDLHIEFTDSVNFLLPNNDDPGCPTQDPKGTFKESQGNGSQVVDLAEGFNGNGVNKGKSVILTFCYGGTNVTKSN